MGYDDELQPAMEYVFGTTFVCDTLESAKKVRDVHAAEILSVWVEHTVSDF